MDDVAGYAFVGLNQNGTPREFWVIDTPPGMRQLRFPSGIAISSGSAFSVSADSGNLVPICVHLHGCLTAAK